MPAFQGKNARKTQDPVENASETDGVWIGVEY
jgi:hypothetical protein